MRLETERLILREMTLADEPALQAIMQDEAVMYAYNGPFTDAEVREWLERQLARYREYGFGLLAVTRKPAGEMIGQCGLSMQTWNGRQVLEIGYLFRQSAWHHGYAAEAAAACKAYAFDVLKAPEVCSIIRDTNAASRHVAERNGMTVAETWTKHYRGEDMPHLLYTVRRGESPQSAQQEESL